MSEMTETAIHANSARAPKFWRSDALPFIEARSIEDGREVCYAKHSHETFSIGAVTGGRSVYVNRHAREWIGAGAVVMMNPDDVHACNPVADERWSYRMLHVDVAWLTKLQHDLGFSGNQAFRAFSQTMTLDEALFDGLNRLYTILVDHDADMLRKESAAITFFSEVQHSLNPAAPPDYDASRQITRAAEFIAENCTRSLKLEEVCEAAELSPSHLIRAFKQRYGMTPHAYLINRRIQYSRAQLRRGRVIADVALDAGFADQAHLQRTFKRLVAATPGQYRT
ncbi:AraC family transcriptional regulator [Paraburkholderia ginsengiterrae]|uniref:AraC family transcriptional regulator n=1 Tax=Paraburkholderia ginsengiterrae TaxID=1462993 RepID=A0A1A9NCE0_9BURK|nr:AraC family transcriptional regulator [Paraburkholderia ginsengiterrae]OAJ60519.1 AraC family transcriptional regulator [Paraburkholderia ginsengiterrae]OAJ64070.1 AraC family transcriptional regulator [Paraburkholderia ginsengiterrae]